MTGSTVTWREPMDSRDKSMNYRHTSDIPTNPHHHAIYRLCRECLAVARLASAEDDWVHECGKRPKLHQWGRWSDAELSTLQQCRTVPEAVGRLPGRSVKSIRAKAERIGHKFISVRWLREPS